MSCRCSRSSSTRSSVSCGGRKARSAAGAAPPPPCPPARGPAHVPARLVLTSLQATLHLDHLGVAGPKVTHRAHTWQPRGQSRGASKGPRKNSKDQGWGQSPRGAWKGRLTGSRPDC